MPIFTLRLFQITPFLLRLLDGRRFRRHELLLMPMPATLMPMPLFRHSLMMLICRQQRC